MRQAQSAETRERILAAGSELAHKAGSWDWHQLTAQSVAQLAGVSERTIYRYFPAERALHDAIMRRLEQEAGISYERIALDDLGEVSRRLFASLPSFSVPRTVVIRGATFQESDVRRRESLLRALESHTVGWSSAERNKVAGALDLLWTPFSYELLGKWGLDVEAAGDAVTWAIEALAAAIRRDQRPGQRSTRKKQKPSSTRRENRKHSSAR